MSATVKNKLGGRNQDNKLEYLSIEDNSTNNNM